MPEVAVFVSVDIKKLSSDFYLGKLNKVVVLQSVSGGPTDDWMRNAKNTTTLQTEDCKER